MESRTVKSAEPATTAIERALVRATAPDAPRPARNFSLLRPLYYLYERRLLKEIHQAAIPHHIGIILDGNRRFGRRAGLQDPREIYDLGAHKLDEVLDWCGELGIACVTLWVCSTENLRRAPGEISGILAALEAKVRALAEDPNIHRREIRVRATGKLELLPDDFVATIRRAEAATVNYSAVNLTIAVAYGGREEIADAVRLLLTEKTGDGQSLEEIAAQVTPETIGRYLYAPDLPDPDLIIRTSGEIRLSGFLLWQSAYSEFYFSDVHWPAFRRVDFLRAVRAYQQRQRRMGQ